nr:DUF6233 domain-containing protein [Streptomyces sp. SID8377]
MQHLPTAAGQAPREILHRTDCWIDSGEDLTPTEASHQAARPNVELCPLCRPNPPTGPLLYRPAHRLARPRAATPGRWRPHPRRCRSEAGIRFRCI